MHLWASKSYPLTSAPSTGLSLVAVKEAGTLTRSSFTFEPRGSMDHTLGKDGFPTASQKEFTHLTLQDFE